MATFYTSLRHLDRDEVEAELAAWSEDLLRHLPPPAASLEAVSVDGKTLRGSQAQGALDVHLLSALSQRLGLTLAQHVVSDKINEIPVALDLLEMILIAGRVSTMAALLTQRKIAQTIVEGKGDPGMVAEENQPQLHADVRDTTFAEDHSQVRIGNIPHLMAAFRNVAVLRPSRLGSASAPALLMAGCRSRTLPGEGAPSAGKRHCFLAPSS